MHRAFRILPAVFLLAGTLVASDAGAILRPRQSTTHATNVCQSALPVFDSSVRKRPLAVQNEGSGYVFVTCSYQSGEGRTAGASNATRVVQYLINNTNAGLTVLCTAVTGGGTPGSENHYKTKGAHVPPVGGPDGANRIVWVGADFPGQPSTIPGEGLFSISCGLPPGTGLSQATVDSDTEIGN